MSDYSFDKDTILSRPIKDENDLAEVIVEMRKAIGSLLEVNDNLQREVDTLRGEVAIIRGLKEAEEIAERCRRPGLTYPTLPTTTTTTWPGALRTGGDYFPSIVTEPATNIADSIVHPPVIGGET